MVRHQRRLVDIDRHALPTRGTQGFAVWRRRIPRSMRNHDTRRSTSCSKLRRASRVYIEKINQSALAYARQVIRREFRLVRLTPSIAFGRNRIGMRTRRSGYFKDVERQPFFLPRLAADRHRSSGSMWTNQGRTRRASAGSRIPSPAHSSASFSFLDGRNLFRARPVPGAQHRRHRAQQGSARRFTAPSFMDRRSLAVSL